MPDDVIRVELDCVSGEKIIFRRAASQDALIEVWLDGQKVEVKPQTFWLAVVAFSDKENS